MGSQSVEPDTYVGFPMSDILALTDLTNSSVDILVIGAGPTGIGAAKRLNQIVRFHSPSFSHYAYT